MLKVAIVNDTSSSRHFGCQLVMDTFRKEFKQRDVKILGTVPVGVHWASHRSILDKTDLVVVNGEGSIHDGNYEELINIAGHYPCALVNTSFQSVPRNENLNKFKYISVRESLSQRSMMGHGIVAEVVPDLIFAHKLEREPPEGDTVILDSINASYGLSPHSSRALEIIARARRMVTGRFHGACLALMWKMDFSAYPSNTYKTAGMMMDAGCRHLYFDTQDEAMDNVQEFDGSEYVENARIAIGRMFDDICQ